MITLRCKYALTMRRWISQNNIRLPRGAFFISALFFFNAVCIVSDNLLIIESFGEMAYNISYLTRVPGTNTLLACCCLLRPEEVNSEY
ncbi:cold-shock protein [Escherichia coli LAU-EC7]|nr:Sfa protein [Escherichia coli O25b:H4]ETE27294.1 cold-shock protein [Escherichia coli LAU-EC7]CDN81450.1 Sfa protein [Escherichia coli O25b:H4-ST131]